MVKVVFVGATLCFTWVVEAQDAVTRAWHFARSPIGNFIGSARPKEITELPQPSVFANKGDRLIDLTESESFKIARDNKAWLVWNDTQKHLIAHGNPLVLAYTENDQALEREEKLLLSFAWYRGVPVGEPVPDHLAPEHQMEITACTGMPVEGAWKSSREGRLKGGKIHSEPIKAAGQIQAFSANSSIQWSEQVGTETRNWTLDAAGRGGDGEVRIIAQISSPFGDTWTITQKDLALLQDDTPVGASRWIEVDGKAVLITNHKHSGAALPKELNVQGQTYLVAEFFVPSLFDPTTTEQVLGQDPFAADETPLKEVKMMDFKAMTVPEELKKWVPSPMMDLRAWLREKGVPLSEKDFAGYDPAHPRILVAVQKEDCLDLMEELFSPMCMLAPVLVEMELNVVRIQGDQLITSHGFKIGCPSGQKAKIECVDQQGKRRLWGELEPTMSANNKDIDMLVKLEWPANAADPMIDLTTSANLQSGVESVLQRNKSGDTITKVTLKATALVSERH